jgi:toxin ParE1/3/4
MRVRFAEKAESDLIEVGRYIAQDNVETALQFIGKIEAICHDTIGQHPEVGRQRDDLIEGLRMFPYQHYVIFYRIQSEWVEIVRVLHASRDVENMFDTAF